MVRKGLNKFSILYKLLVKYLSD